MALIKTGTTVANVAASQQRVDELAKLAEGGLVIGLNVASQNYLGAVSKGVAVGAQGLTSVKDNFDFIAEETKGIKKWDDEHNEDGSEKKVKL